MITLDMYLMGRDKTHKNELTPDIIDNAKKLIAKVNALLQDLGWTKDVKVSSGWRPAAINAGIGNASKKSSHMTGVALDLEDNKDQELGKLVLSRPDLLKKHGLWLEDLSNTIGKFTNWVHLDFKERTARDIQVFKP